MGGRELVWLGRQEAADVARGRCLARVPRESDFSSTPFSTSATPSAMARVFQAYQCRYAMLLDMNALEHTYLAIYKRQGSNLYVQHLIQGMSEVDRSVKGQYIPRFLGYSDNRDFFYLTRKETP